jgi:hypothetical protein
VAPAGGNNFSGCLKARELSRPATINISYYYYYYYYKGVPQHFENNPLGTIHLRRPQKSAGSLNSNTPSICKREQWIYCFITIESANTWQILRPPLTPLVRRCLKCMAPYREFMNRIYIAS